ncbi:MAG: Rrf2 family transcriptional regulator [Methylophilaceae bacterium]|tara:strand:- start:829 stop:1308 length:480 start_codon:yes stop_codon:yes gene_type:complete
MKLTTKGRFAVTAILDLALNESNNPVSLSDISKRQSISLSYLEQLFSRMRRVGLVKSIRGPGGGYKTAIDYNTLTVKDIITSVEEQIDATQCGGNENCHEGGRCITHNLWASLNHKILDYLESLTLAQLIDEQKNKTDEHSIYFAPKKINMNKDKLEAV